MIGSLEAVFHQLVYSNSQEIFRRILSPLCRSTLNPSNEIQTIEALLNEFKNLEAAPLNLAIPTYLHYLGILGGAIIVRTGRTHKRNVTYLTPTSAQPIPCETSDIALLVSYEYAKRDLTLLVDQKVSFLQAKLGKDGDRFDIDTRQWYLMRYWPKFSYEGSEFDLSNCRKSPDICSFYIMIFRQREFSEVVSAWMSDCTANAVYVSTPYMGERKPVLKSITDSHLVGRRSVSLAMNFGYDGDGFSHLLWDALSMHLGAYDAEGTALMETMFPEAFSHDDPDDSWEIGKSEKPSIGVNIRVQLKVE